MELKGGKGMKRVISFAVCLCLAMGMLAGCGAKEKDEKKEAEDITQKEKGDRQITFMIPDWGVPTDEMLEDFTGETGIDVVINEVSWDDIRDKIAIAASGGSSAADVVEVDWSWVGEFYAADWLEEIRLSEEEKADMPTLDTFTIEGKVLAVPYANDYRLSYYNTEHYKEAGIQSAPETWEQVYENAKKLKEAGVAEYPFAIPLNAEEAATTSLIWLAYTMNGAVFHEDGTLIKDSVLAALSYEEKMLREELIDPADKTSSGMDAYRRLLSGDASFMTGPTSFVARSSNSEECSIVGQIEPILVPGKTGTSEHTMALPEAIGITKFSKNKKEAETFVKWYTSPEIQKELYKTKSAIPTHNTILEELINDGSITDSGAMLEEAERISSPFPNGVPSYYAEMSNAIYNAVNKMALGELTAEEAFEEMDSKITELAGK